jgi:hypothetical protein
MTGGEGGGTEIFLPPSPFTIYTTYFINTTLGVAYIIYIIS